MGTSVPSYEFTDCRAKIADFSSAFLVGHEPKNVRITLLIAPFGALFDEKLTFSMNIWSFLRHRGWWSSTFSFLISGGRDGLIEDTAVVLGPLPRSSWERWKRREDYFTKDGNWIESCDFEPARPEYGFSYLRRFETLEASRVTKVETASLKSLLSVMLVYAGLFATENRWLGGNCSVRCSLLSYLTIIG